MTRSSEEPEHPSVGLHVDRVPLNIICLSHLAWQTTLFQRPQQLMLQFAQQGHRVLYAGCIGLGPLRQLKRVQTANGYPVDQGNLRFVNLAFSPHSRRLLPLRRKVVLNRLRSEIARHLDASRPTVVWAYHPGLLQIATELQHNLLVYDIMDRFDAFDGSARDVVSSELSIVAAAEVIFAGGLSLAEHGRQLIKTAGRDVDVHCFPSGIDWEHFSKARAQDTTVPADVVELRRPVLGYFGAIDERIDFELLRQVAELRREWTILLIGPVLQRPDELPSNIHLIGGRPYAELPAYLKTFDVALLPFRKTDLVAHISPTKTPEYLCGGKPVVSTRIPDVISDYGEVVQIVDGAGSFVSACDKLLAQPQEAGPLVAKARQRAMTWKQIAELMETSVMTKIHQLPTAR